MKSININYSNRIYVNRISVEADWVYFSNHFALYQIAIMLNFKMGMVSIFYISLEALSSWARTHHWNKFYKNSKIKSIGGDTEIYQSSSSHPPEYSTSPERNWILANSQTEKFTLSTCRIQDALEFFTIRFFTRNMLVFKWDSLCSANGNGITTPSYECQSNGIYVTNMQIKGNLCMTR